MTTKQPPSPEPYRVLATPKRSKDAFADATVTPTAEPDVKFSFLDLYRYADRKDAVLMILGLSMSIINGAAMPFMAILFGNVINSFSPYNQSAINETCLYYLILAVVMFLAGYGSYTCFAVTAERQMRSLRREVLKHIMYQEIGWYDQRDASELASRISGDTVKIKEGMANKLGEAVQFVCQFVAGYAIGFYKGWNIALVMCAIMPMMAITMTFLIKRLRDSTAQSQRVYAAAGAVAEETIGAIRTVASLNGEPRAVKKYDEIVQKAEVDTLGLARFVSFSFGWFMMSIWLTYAIGLWFGGYLLSAQNDAVKTPGSVFSAFYGILFGTMSLSQISPNVSAVASAKGAAHELYKILSRPSKIDAANLDGDVPTYCNGKVDVQDLVFAYPTRPDDVV
ncbi:ATP-binding Cassette (ABC) Superfamily, partial [Achlya hypogyna]